MSDFASRRTMMVDTQIRPSDVTRYPIIAAMLAVPRELFVPPKLVEAAYVGENLTLGPGRVLLEPRTLAKMLDALAIGEADLVLDLAAGTGYSSAVVSRMAQAVVAVEPDAELASEAETLLAEHGAGNVLVETRPAVEGALAHGPFDVMLVQGAVESWPDSLTAQLREGGRVAALFAAPRAGAGLGTVRLGVRIGDTIAWRDLFHAGAPVLPGFEQEEAFAL